MPPDPQAIRDILILATRLEYEESRRLVPGAGPRNLPFMPYQIPEFLALLAEAIPAAPGSRFLEVGTIGTKMLLAREIFGCSVTGIEVNPGYAAQAADLGLDVVTADALDYGGYGAHDLIWLYRPLRDPDAEAGLEKIIWDQMAPGAVIMGAALETPPPPGRFQPVLEDFSLPRGIWRKAG